MLRRAIWLTLVALVIATAVTGCSSQKKRQVVSGTVSRAQPLPTCFIRFHGPNGILTTTPVEPDGSFTMTDVFPGEYKVTFQIEVEKGSWRDKKDSKSKPKPTPIPAKYLDPATTDLVFTITPETTRLDIEIK